MGGGVEEGHPLPVQLPLPLHLPPEGPVGPLQVGEGTVQPPGQLVQAAAQPADLVPAFFAALPVEVQLRHLPGDGAHAHDGPGDVPGVEESAQQREYQQHQQQPGGHLRQGPHRQVLRLDAGGDIEGVAPTPTGKGHLGGDGGPVGGGDGHGLPGVRVCPIADHRLPLRRGDGHTFILIHRVDRQPGPGVHQLPVRPQQHGVGPGGEDELVQQFPAVLRRGVRQPLHQIVHLGGEVVVHHGGVGAGGGPGDEAEGNCPGEEQDAGGNQEDAGCQAFSDPLSRHDSPPPSPFRCSPAPACGGGS